MSDAALNALISTTLAVLIAAMIGVFIYSDVQRANARHEATQHCANLGAIAVRTVQPAQYICVKVAS